MWNVAASYTEVNSLRGKSYNITSYCMYNNLGIWKKKKVATVQMRIMARLHSLLCMFTRFCLFFSIQEPARKLLETLW